MFFIFLLLFLTFVINQVHAEPIASHGDVIIFRELKKNEIEAQKRTSRTDKEAVAALALLYNELDCGTIEIIPFSKLALAILIGRGYEKGVTTELKATPVERQIMIRVAEKAVAHARGIDFKNDQIWFQKPTTTVSIDEHARILNDLMKKVKNEEPHFDYTSENATPYKNLDRIVTEIVVSHARKPGHDMLCSAQQHSLDLAHSAEEKLKHKQFILTYDQLSEAQQNEIFYVYNELIANLGQDNAIVIIPDYCNDLDSAKAFVRQRILKPVIDLIDAIPGGQPITSLDSQGSTIAQRNAIRAFLIAIVRLGPEEKEICLEELFSKKKHSFIIPAVQQNIIDEINKINTKPEIKNMITLIKAIDKGQSPEIRSARAAIERLPDIQREIYYHMLIEKIRAIRPIFPGVDIQGKKDNVIFKEKLEQLIKDLINARGSAITPPKELVSPEPVIVNPAGSIDSVQDVNMIDPSALLITIDPITHMMRDPRNIAFETRLKNFFVNHWQAYYKPEGPAVNTSNAKAALQQNFNDINNMAPNFIERRKLKVTLVETLLQRLLEIAPQDIWTLETLIPQNDRDLAALLTASSHVYTNIEKIKELPSTNWDMALENHVFNVHGNLRRAQGETDAAYWRRIGEYIIGIYNAKIKPHVYPDGLLNTFQNNQNVDLVPFITMFTDSQDASHAINLNVSV